VPSPVPRSRAADLWLLLAALAGGVVFFLSLGSLWPLARIDLHVPRPALEAKARETLERAGVDVSEHRAESALRVDAFALDYLQRSFGPDHEAEAQRSISLGLPIYRYDVLLKRFRDPDRYWVHLHPGAQDGGDLRVLAWGRTVQEDASGETVSAEAARRTALDALSPFLGGGIVAPGPGDEPGRAGFEERPWREEGFYEQARPSRLDHYFVYERHLSETPPLRERLVVTVSGGEVTSVEHALVPPEAARRAARTRRAPTVALQTTGFLLAAVAVIGAFAVFLTRLRAGTARLGPAARWVTVIGACALVTQALRGHELLFRWDPLWPRWVAGFQSLAEGGAQGAWILLVLFVMIAAGDALDRESRAERGASLQRVARGRLLSAPVGLASLRGFLVGLVCGGVLAGSILALEAVFGGWSPIQPQGFFFFALNSRAPAVATLLYFLMVALVEELAYRFFAGTWLLSVTGKRWLAIVVPAVLYGATHTGLEFLPPAEPFWGRAVALTLVGCVWGWAFLRFDALTVVLSHFTADLFIFNWPRLGSGDPVLVAKALATVAVPLLPAILWYLVPGPWRGGADEGGGSGGEAEAAR
jgi:hypothetical protein